MDVLLKIRSLAQARGWSISTLANHTGLPASTISALFTRNSTPTIPILARITEALGITLSEFFAEDDTVYTPTTQERTLLHNWSKLDAKHKKLIFDYVDFLYQQGHNANGE